MSAVVIVHTDPASTIALLERAGFHVHVAGELDLPAYTTNHERGIGRRSDPPTPPTVLIITQAAERAA